MSLAATLPTTTTTPFWDSLTHGITGGWQSVLQKALATPSSQKLAAFLESEPAFYPARANIFNALRLTPLEDVRVVILGQDPYHGEGQAQGLSFSVPAGIKLPPSLRNIYKEVFKTTPAPKNGDLTAWAKQGVLLLNTVMTVRPEQAGSHQGKGWEEITDTLISAVNSNCKNVVFMLWGSHAQKKAALIDAQKHLILTAPHPSPLSAHRGFIGCGHFEKASAYLVQNAGVAIDWTLAG